MISMRCCLLLICVSLIIIDEIQSKPNQTNQNESAKAENNTRRSSGRKIPKDDPPMSNRHRRQTRFNNFPQEVATKRTKDGTVYRGGVDIFPAYSGSADFAFDGDSFRPSKYGLYNIPEQPQTTTTTQRNFDWVNTFNPQGLPPDWINQIPNDLPPNWQNQNGRIVNQNQNSNTVQDPPGKPNPCQVECHKRVTSQYTPVCGSDNVTYTNFEKFRCAQKCGKQITGRQNVSCGFGRPVV
ncbi:uncharacterized protein LOC143916612 [Arctopsyche grandis]|uniref:uncharacterized protein LOC143916612 n=1 Tax=Arctopsyche grandis TaxID=121162 RepID=UPI00406D6832